VSCGWLGDNVGNDGGMGGKALFGKAINIGGIPRT